jgi:hypothetical protein
MEVKENTWLKRGKKAKAKIFTGLSQLYRQEPTANDKTQGMQQRRVQPEKRRAARIDRADESGFLDDQS